MKRPRVRFRCGDCGRSVTVNAGLRYERASCMGCMGYTIKDLRRLTAIETGREVAEPRVFFLNERHEI